jgi:hypothetical protein
MLNDLNKQLLKSNLEKTLHNLMRYKTSFEVARYVIDQNVRNWRDFEEDFSNNYPLQGSGVIASQAELRKWTYHNNPVLNTEVDIGGHEVSEELGTFPLKDMAVLYLFTIIEGFGNDLLHIKNPTYSLEKRAWHHKIDGFQKATMKQNIEQIIQGFISPFGFKEKEVINDIAASFSNFKYARNAMAHGDNADMDFDGAFSTAIATVLHLYFLATDDHSEIRVLPWTDYSSKCHYLDEENFERE